MNSAKTRLIYSQSWNSSLLLKKAMQTYQKEHFDRNEAVSTGFSGLSSTCSQFKFIFWTHCLIYALFARKSSWNFHFLSFRYHRNLLYLSKRYISCCLTHFTEYSKNNWFTLYVMRTKARLLPLWTHAKTKLVIINSKTWIFNLNMCINLSVPLDDKSVVSFAVSVYFSRIGQRELP